MVRASCRFARDVGAESEARGQEFRLKSGGDLIQQAADQVPARPHEAVASAQLQREPEDFPGG